VQKWLSDNRSFLNSHGVFYPSHSLDINGVSSGNVKSIYDVDDKKQLTLSTAKLTELLTTFNASNCSMLLLSSEFYFRKMEELKIHIPNAKFIAYVRNPLEIKESSYNQSVKRHFQLDTISVGRSKRLPYMARLIEFTETYGTSDLYLKLYGDKYFKHGNIVSDLLSVLGIDTNVRLPVVNSSYQFEALEFKRWINQFHLEDYQVLVDRALQGFNKGTSDYSLIPPKQYREDSIYYASVLEKHAKELKTVNLAPLVADMSITTAKPFLIQELTDEQFLSICHNLQKVLRVDYYLLTKKVMSLSPIQNPHFHHLFIKSCNKKYRYIHLLLVGCNHVRRVVKNGLKALKRLF
jgi:hypothetical protein